MYRFALNHMTLAKASYTQLLAMAAQLGCVGVEVRNDLRGELFDGMCAADAGQAARDAGLQILALAEVCAFDNGHADKLAETKALAALASACGASCISLIPRNDSPELSEIDRRRNLTAALQQFQPVLEAFGLVGLIEPLGFQSCSVRSKTDVVETIETLDAAHCYKLVHDTFHHHLAGGGPVFAEHTGIVHVSGVSNARLSVCDMQDADRGLVDAGDRLGNREQLQQLTDACYTGPVSIEAFAADVHALKDPLSALSDTMAFLQDAVQLEPA